MNKKREMVADGRYPKRPYRDHAVVEEKIKRNKERQKELEAAKTAVPVYQCFVCGNEADESVMLRGITYRLCTKHADKFQEELSKLISKEFTDEGVLPTVVEGIPDGPKIGARGKKQSGTD